jgi:predicted O-linked N-acetylglucosamine transferase (SPINDLY family)
VTEQFKSDGIDSHRVRFVGKQPLADYLRWYDQIDVALDTFPYGGGTTTCDALWMGVPVVTLIGKTAVGRGGLSILSNIRLPELAAASEDQYVRAAVELAVNPERLGALRSNLRQRMEDSPVMDAPRFAANIEIAYRQMWRRWCESLGQPRE